LTLDLVRLRRHPQPAGDVATDAAAMRLYVMDAWVRDERVLVDRSGLRRTLYAAAHEGRARVVGEAFHVFPNGAVTGVLVLAQSHLSIHTWPELALANVDLLTYGAVDGERVLAVVRKGLDAARTNVDVVVRGSP
jgi:S-adenosylmethionine decarboxylase